jgi:type IV pilus assembly protein PilQ
MRKRNRFIGSLFFALLAVYSFGAGRGSGADSPAAAAGTDPFDSPATQPVQASTGAPAAPPKITATESGTFSIQINNDVPLVEVLRMIGSQAQVSIVPSREVRGTVPAMDLYNVTVPEALDAILTSNGCGYEQKGNIVFVFSDKELQDRKKKELETDVYRLYYINADDAIKVLKPALSDEGKISETPASDTGTGSGSASGGGGGASGGGGSSGGASSSSGSSSSGSSSNGGSSSGGSSGGGSSIGGNSYASQDLIVVTDHPENQQKVAQVVKEIDRRPRQVLVEATILEAELDESNQLGVNFTALGSINFADLGSIPGAIAGAALSASNAKKSYSTIQTGQGGLQFGIVQDNVAVFLTALEGVTNTTVLSNPKVLTLDKQPGYVHIGETIYYTGQTTQNDQTTTAAVQSLATGITLTFRPYIGDDGFIRMEIDPNDSNPIGSVTVTGSTVLPPNINDNEVSSNIMVKDGQTVLIGGLFKDNDVVNKNQVPFFGGLPGVGPLFGMQKDTTTRNEIIFLLTPHIVKDQQAFNDLSEAELKEAEKLRVGVRRDMLPWGRERLADNCYEAAQTELAKPHPDMNLVRWHLDCATNLNPHFIEAIDLKEKVTGNVVTAADNSTIRSYVRREMLAESQSTAQRQPDEIPPKFVHISVAEPHPVATTQNTSPAAGQPNP